MSQNSLKEEILIEIESIEIVIKEINSLRNEIIDREPSIREKAALSSFLMQVYNGIENIFKRICKHYYVPLPRSESWHIELFEKFSFPTQAPLPNLIPEEIKLDLIALRRFRHFIHHGYSFKIEWVILEIGVKKIDNVFAIFKIELMNFINTINE